MIIRLRVNAPPAAEEVVVAGPRLHGFNFARVSAPDPYRYIIVYLKG